jgi:hypothetical protein
MELWPSFKMAIPPDGLNTNPMSPCRQETDVQPAYDRAWIAAVLTAQAGLGAVLGVAVQALVAWGLIIHTMPAVGNPASTLIASPP